MTSYSLYELNFFIKNAIELNFPEPIWVKCEIAQVKLSRGHHYIDLVQKDEKGDDIIAQNSAVIWSNTYAKLHRKLGMELQALLKEGMEVLMYAKLNFHERYGMKLYVEDFDTAYSMGKMELKKRETIQQLKQLNLLDKNQQHSLPSVIQKIAVISSETAAGYQDFLQQLKENHYGFVFRIDFFQASMQGNLVESEVSHQISNINKKATEYEAIVIIRGGGAKLDLSAFDGLGLCMSVANAKLPVLTGIGHDMDETVLDIVAHTSLKTPTAVAEFIIQHNLLFETELIRLSLEINTQTQKLLSRESLSLQSLYKDLHLRAFNLLSRQQLMLEYIGKEVSPLAKAFIKSNYVQLENLDKTSRLLSPETALKRGFSITTQSGRVVLDSSSLSVGEEIETRFFKGSTTSIIKKTINE